MSTNTLQAKIKELKEFMRMQEELTEEIESIKDSLKQELAQRGTDELVAGEYKVRYTAVTSNRFDTTAFKKLYGDLYSQFVKTSTSRRFTVI